MSGSMHIPTGYALPLVFHDLMSSIYLHESSPQTNKASVCNTHNHNMSFVKGGFGLAYICISFHQQNQRYLFPIYMKMCLCCRKFVDPLANDTRYNFPRVKIQCSFQLNSKMVLFLSTLMKHYGSNC